MRRPASFSAMVSENETLPGMQGAAAWDPRHTARDAPGRYTAETPPPVALSLGLYTSWD